MIRCTAPMRARAEVEFTITRADGTVEPPVRLPVTLAPTTRRDRLRAAWLRFLARVSTLED